MEHKLLIFPQIECPLIEEARRHRPDEVKDLDESLRKRRRTDSGTSDLSGQSRPADPPLPVDLQIRKQSRLLKRKVPALTVPLFL